MLVGSTGMENVMALILGPVTLLLGIALLRWRAQFTRAVARVQRVGAPATSQRWAAVVVGIGWILGGTGVLLLGLFYRFP